MVNGPDITPNAAGVYVGNNAVSSQTSNRNAGNAFGYWGSKVGIGLNGVMGGSLWFVSDDKVTRIDAVTGAFQSEILLPPGYVGIDIMPSCSFALSYDDGSSWPVPIDDTVVWCYCRRIFFDDICKIVINSADNSFIAVLSVTNYFSVSDFQRLPARGQYYPPSWYGDAPGMQGWFAPVCDSERRLVWSLATRTDGPVEGLLIRTNVSKPLNDGWAYNYYSDFVPPIWNSSKQKQGCSMFPIGGYPTGIVVLDDGSVFVSQMVGSAPYYYKGASGLVVKFSPWIDQEVTETYESFSYDGTSVNYEGPVEDARAEFDYRPNKLITDGSNVWGSTQNYDGGTLPDVSIFRISGTSGELTHEMQFPGEEVIDMTEGGVYLYVLVRPPYSNPGNTGVREDTRLVKLYKSDLSVVDDMAFPNAARLISYDSQTLWVKVNLYSPNVANTWSSVDRMYKINKSLIGAPWWLSPSYPLGYTDVDGVERGSSSSFESLYAEGHLSRGTPGSWGGHLIFIDKPAIDGGIGHTLLFDPITGYVELMDGVSSVAHMPEYGRGNQGGGAGLYYPPQAQSGWPSGHVFSRLNFPRPLPPNSHIAIHDAPRPDMSWGYRDRFEGSQNHECSVLYEGDTYITAYYGGTLMVSTWNGYISWDFFMRRIGTRYYPVTASTNIYFMQSFSLPELGVTEMRSMGPDILLYHDHKNVPQSPTSWDGYGSEFDPVMAYGNITFRNGPNGAWRTIDADIVCSDHTDRSASVIGTYGVGGDRNLGMMFFDTGSQNLYSGITVETSIWEYVAVGAVTHLPDLSYGLQTNSPFLMQVGPVPAREGSSVIAKFGAYQEYWDGNPPSPYQGGGEKALYVLSDDWGIKAYHLVAYPGGYRPVEILDVAISNDPNRARSISTGARPKELIPNNNGFFVLDTNNIVKRINVTPPEPTLRFNYPTITRADVFGNDNLANARFGPAWANEKLSHIYWEFGDGTSGEDSGYGLYPAGQTGGVVVWPPLGYIDHVYAPGVYQVRVIGVYGRSNSYSSEGYLGSRPYSSAPYPYDTNPNGSYLTGEIDTTSISRVVSREMTVIIQSKTSATIGVSPITTIDESYIENGTLVLNMVPQYIGAPVDMAKRASMVLNFFHISSYTDPLVSYANYANGYLELNYQFDGGQEQYFLDQNWASQGESLLVYRNFQSDWAADQQFIGNEFDLVGRWRSSSNSSIVSPPVRLRVRIVRIGDTGVPNWSLDHIEIAPDLQ